MSKKVTKVENLKGTFVFTIDSLIPFRKADLEKIRGNALCDNLDEISPHRIRITRIVTNGSAEYNHLDEEIAWWEIAAECIKTELDEYLASIRHSLRECRFHRTQIFLT